MSLQLLGVMYTYRPVETILARQSPTAGHSEQTAVT